VLTFGPDNPPSPNGHLGTAPAPENLNFVSVTYTFTAACPLWISASETGSIPDVYFSPPAPCSTFTSKGTFSAVSCASGTWDSSSGNTTLTSQDPGGLSNITYHVDLYGGLGLLSGTASEANETGTADLYGVLVMLPSISSSSDLPCPRQLYVAGAIVVVEGG
jgi:hypothetical protein